MGCGINKSVLDGPETHAVEPQQIKDVQQLKLNQSNISYTSKFSSKLICESQFNSNNEYSELRLSNSCQTELELSLSLISNSDTL